MKLLFPFLTYMFQKNPPIQPSPASDFEPVASYQDDVETVVGPSVHVEGDFASAGNIIVKGSVSGNVKTSQKLSVEQGAKILANVLAGSAIIAGQVKGDLKIEDRLELTETAQVLGDISCQTLVVAAGALVHGKVAMKGVEMEDPRSSRRRVTRGKEKETVEEGELEISL